MQVVMVACLRSRWRKLEGTDPTAYEMILKCQTLQKRLIKRTEQVVDKDMQLQEKEKLYVELKTILSRQPGPEVAHQLSLYQVCVSPCLWWSPVWIVTSMCWWTISHFSSIRCTSPRLFYDRV